MTGNTEFEVGFNIPAKPGMSESEIQTPCLVLDLDALERNIKKMGDYAKAHNMRHRVHGKMHKSVDVAKLQEKLGGAVGKGVGDNIEAQVFSGWSRSFRFRFFFFGEGVKFALIAAGKKKRQGKDGEGAKGGRRHEIGR